MKTKTILATPAALALFFMSCTMTPNFEAQIQKNRQAGSGQCQNMINDVYKNYCTKMPKRVPVGYSDNVERTRNSISLNCKDANSQKELKKIDNCIDKLRSREQ